MDPAVAAAIIGVPVAIAAAGAAYAAGRAQGRGTHRGAVDAVRRQHQRDAYAAMLKAARAYLKSVYAHWTAFDAGRVSGSPPQGLDEVMVALAALSTDELQDAAATVELEGTPKVILAVDRLMIAVHRLTISPTDLGDVGRQLLLQDIRQVHSRIYDFTEAAREHLNGIR
ncbi:hypothetical protein [Streptomyces chartreusis]